MWKSPSVCNQCASLSASGLLSAFDGCLRRMRASVDAHSTKGLLFRSPVADALGLRARDAADTPDEHLFPDAQQVY